jgi:F-type H+-transporting ATPase subunit delta
VSQISPVSKRYAKALYGAVKDKVATLNELRVLIKIISEDPIIDGFFSSHTQPEHQKLDVLAKSIQGKGLSEEVGNFLKVLIIKGRSAHLKDTLTAYEALVDAENGVTRGNVKSAVKLDADARQRIEAVISHFVKKKVILNYSEDPKLVGGVLAQVGGWTFEDTLDSHLRRLKEDLNRRAN